MEGESRAKLVFFLRESRRSSRVSIDLLNIALFSFQDSAPGFSTHAHTPGCAPPPHNTHHTHFWIFILWSTRLARAARAARHGSAVTALSACALRVRLRSALDAGRWRAGDRHITAPHQRREGCLTGYKIHGTFWTSSYKVHLRRRTVSCSTSKRKWKRETEGASILYPVAHSVQVSTKCGCMWLVR